MTAKEFLSTKRHVILAGDDEYSVEIQNYLIEFAKYHVEQALLRASTEATTKTEMVYTGGLDPDKNLYEPEQIIDEDSIKNAYSLDNIK